MKKIPTIFQRDPHNLARVTSMPNTEASWVFDGVGNYAIVQKYDGQCVDIRPEGLWKRRALKPGQYYVPDGWEPETDIDFVTGKREGWVPVGEGPENAPLREAYQLWCDAQRLQSRIYPPGEEYFPYGTAEACGPEINGNPENLMVHMLFSHQHAPKFGDLEKVFFENCNFWYPPGCRILPKIAFAVLKAWLSTKDIEGLIFRHKDGRLAKIKKKDFGLPRKPDTAPGAPREEET